MVGTVVATVVLYVLVCSTVVHDFAGMNNRTTRQTSLLAQQAGRQAERDKGFVDKKRA
jgi:hypothetical protein